MRTIRRGSGSVVTWRLAQMVLLAAQGMDAAAIAKVAFTSEDRVRDVIRNFNADGFGSLYPRYKGGHPPKFTLGQRREIKKIAKSRPAERVGQLYAIADREVAPQAGDPEIAIICDNYSPHLSTRKDRRAGTWAAANNVEIACTPTNSSWLNRIEAQFTALRYFALDGTDHASHKEQASMIRRYIIWRNNHAYDERLRRIVNRANIT